MRFCTIIQKYLKDGEGSKKNFLLNPADDSVIPGFWIKIYYTALLKENWLDFCDDEKSTDAFKSKLNTEKGILLFLL
jgi:hypothetical protein